MITTDCFIPLTDDIMFKHIFGSSKNIKFIEDFLECYFNYPSGSLNGKVSVNSEALIDKLNYYDKNMRADVLISIPGMYINLEMNSIYNEEAEIKSKAYVMRIYISQIIEGFKYSDIVKVTQINFINESKIKIQEELKNSIMIGKDFRIDTIRLDKIREIPYNNDRYYKWLKFIASENQKSRDEIAKGDEILMELSKVIDKFYLDNKDDETLTQGYWDRRIYTRLGEENGIKNGIKIGEDNSKKEIAKKMLNKGQKYEEISELTGLSTEEIKQLL